MLPTSAQRVAPRHHGAPVRENREGRAAPAGDDAWLAAAEIVDTPANLAFSCGG